jgi:hypothetical protein
VAARFTVLLGQAVSGVGAEAAFSDVIIVPLVVNQAAHGSIKRVF